MYTTNNIAIKSSQVLIYHVLTAPVIKTEDFRSLPKLFKTSYYIIFFEVDL